MNKYLKYSIRSLAIVISVFLVLYIIAYIYVSLNKKTIIAEVTKQISEKLNGTVAIGNVDLSFLRTFPQISVQLEKVSIKDTMFEQHKHPFFTAKKLFAQISVFQVIAKKDPLTGLRVDDGNLYIFTDSTGYTNNYLLKGKQSDEPTRPTAAKRTVLNKITMNNFNITLRDDTKSKWHEFDVEKIVCDISDKDSILKFQSRNNIHIKSLAFNTNRGSYVKDKTFSGNIKVFFNQKNKQLFFNDIHIKLNKQSYRLSGNFILDKQPRFALGVQTKSLDFNEAKSLLPQQVSLVLSKFAFTKPIDVKAIIQGPLTKGDPLVNVEWVSHANNTVTTPFFVFEKTNFSGNYTNELVAGLPRKDPNSRIQITNFTGTWEGIPLRSENTYIDNLEVPVITLDLHSDFSLAALNQLMESNSIKPTGGNASLNITYSGPLAKNSNQNTNINGTLVINNGQLLYAPRNISMNNCNGTIVFKNTDVSVKDLRTNVQGNSMVMNGSAGNMLSLIQDNPGKILLDWHIYSPNLNLATLTALLQKRNRVSNNYTGKSKMGTTARKLDNMLEQSNVSLSLNADKLNYKKFTASDVKASIDLVQENWRLNNVSLTSGGGSMRMNGWVKEKNARVQEVKLKVNVDNADVNKIMYAFNNFGQDGISYKNLRGRLTSLVDIKMDLARDLSGSPQNMEGNIFFSLKNGALINYEPLKKLQNVVFKNRNFDEVRFAELKDNFEVKGRDIIMQRMEIQSTALTLFVEGIFSMQPGKTDISIQVPINNLKKREDGYQPQNKGSDAKGGASIYVRGRPGDDGTIKFKLDLFKKLRKDK